MWLHTEHTIALYFSTKNFSIKITRWLYDWCWKTQINWWTKMESSGEGENERMMMMMRLKGSFCANNDEFTRIICMIYGLHSLRTCFWHAIPRVHPFLRLDFSLRNFLIVLFFIHSVCSSLGWFWNAFVQSAMPINDIIMGKRQEWCQKWYVHSTKCYYKHSFDNVELHSRVDGIIEQQR